MGRLTEKPMLRGICISGLLFFAPHLGGFSKMKVFVPLLLTCALGVSGCGVLGTGGGGGGGLGGGTGGGSGGSGGAGGSGGGTVSGSGSTSGTGFTGTANMKGVMIQADRNVQIAPPVPGAPTIYETASYPYLDTGPNATATTPTAVLDLQNVTLTGTPGSQFDGSGTGTFTVSGGPSVNNAQASSFLLQAAFVEAGGNPQTSGNQFTLTAEDLDSDGTDDFFMVQLGVGTTNTFPSRSSTGAFYGGTFTPSAAVQQTNTATYSRTDGAIVSTVRGTSIAGGQDTDASVRADVTLTADFDAGTVSGQLSGVGKSGSAAGPTTTTNILLDGATISGNQFTGGTARMVNGATDVFDAGASSDFSGSFMGANGEAAAGAAYITGTIGGDTSAATAVFVGDKQP